VLDSSRTNTLQPGTARGKLAALVWPLVFTMTLMVLLSMASVSMLSDLRAYVNGEGLWSKAERQALSDLREYERSGAESDYRRFQGELRIPLGDRVARLQLQSPTPDLRAAWGGFLDGHNDPADIPGMIRLFRLFGSSSIMAEPLRVWTSGDELILQLSGIGDRLHEQMSSDSRDPVSSASLLREADRVHLRVAPLEDRFSRSLGAVSRTVAGLLLTVLSVCGAVLVCLCAGIFRVHLQRGERMAATLRASERAMAEKLEYQATHDSLTGLCNRPQFESLLAAAIADYRARGTSYAVLYLDLDQFKVINDTSGHAAGDDLIRKVAWLVKDRLREQDVLARLGGDEFGALLCDVGPETALAIAEMIRSRVAELRFGWRDRVFPMTASIGLLRIDHAVADVGEALSAADEACYVAKDSGRNRVQVYRPDDQLVQMRHREMDWVERLNAALDNDRFVLFAQEIRPIGMRHTGRVAAAPRFELLLRMLDTDDSWIAPMAFIPAAERYGLMPRIDRWVIARACRQLAELRVRDDVSPVCMINLSGASVGDPELADYVATCLREHQLPGEQFGFELTETTAVGNLGSASLLMRRMRALGASIALDDFGSGMSSFSYLKALPIDLLKIDGAFVRDVGTNPFDLAVVESIQRIARVMGIGTVAECVEHEGALRALLKVGVDYAQGFHIGRPDLLERVVLRSEQKAPTADSPGEARGRVFIS
jgi:diguanylate cyclase (GGDEF)-like protein